jgi:hypothetical protein
MKTARGQVLSELAGEFAKLLPEYEFSVAALQGYLFLHRMDPFQAAHGLTAWVENERTEKREREERLEAKKRKIMADRAMMMNPYAMLPLSSPPPQTQPQPLADLGPPASPAVSSVPGEQTTEPLDLGRAGPAVVITENGDAAPLELGLSPLPPTGASDRALPN